MAMAKQDNWTDAIINMQNRGGGMLDQNPVRDFGGLKKRGKKARMNGPMQPVYERTEPGYNRSSLKKDPGRIA